MYWSRISSRLVTFGLETDRTRPSRNSSRLVTCRLGLVSSRDFRLVTGSSLSWSDGGSSPVQYLPTDINSTRGKG